MDITKYSDKSFIISGETYSNLDTLKAIKKETGLGVWNRTKKGWMYPLKALGTVLGFIYSDYKNNGEDEKAKAVQNQKNESLDKGDEVKINGIDATIQEGNSDSEGVKYKAKLKDGTELNVNEKVIDTPPETDDKKISETINNSTPETRVQTEKKLYGLKHIDNIHQYSLSEYMLMNGLSQEDVDKYIKSLTAPKKERSKTSSGGGGKSYSKATETDGLSKKQLIAKLVYRHYQAVKTAIDKGEELKPEVLATYKDLQEAYSKKRQAMSEETKRKISEALKKNKADIKEAKKQIDNIVNNKENYKPKEGSPIVITSPKSSMGDSVTLKPKYYTDIPALDVKIPKQKDILDKEKPYFIPEINQDKFRRNGYTLSATKIGEDEYLVALDGFEGGYGSYMWSTASVNKYGNFAVMSLDTYAATQKYYQLKAKEELKRKNIKRFEEGNERLKKQIEEYRKQGDEKRAKYLEDYLSNPKRNKPKQTRLKIYDKPDKMSIDQLHMIYAFNRTEDNNTVDKREAWKIYQEQLFKDRKQKQIDLDLQAEHDESAFTKGRETSYGDSGVKDDLFNDYGVKIKRQNGDEISEKETEQIKEALDETSKIFGKNVEMNKKFGLKISHSGNVKMHASKATGIFFPYYKAIGISNEYGEDMFKFVFGHEYAHFTDYWVGKQTGNHFASDKQGSTANKIASTFRKNMNEAQTSDYQTRTCECFARALEMHTAVTLKGDNAIVWDSERYFDAGNYVNKEVYEKQIKPLITQFLEENKQFLKSQNFNILG